MSEKRFQGIKSLKNSSLFCFSIFEKKWPDRIWFLCIFIFVLGVLLCKRMITCLRRSIWWWLKFWIHKLIHLKVWFWQNFTLKYSLLKNDEKSYLTFLKLKDFLLVDSKKRFFLQEWKFSKSLMRKKDCCFFNIFSQFSTVTF